MSTPPSEFAAFRCSIASRHRGDTLAATAPPAPRWLLLEVPGGWPAAIGDHPEFATAEGRQLLAELRQRETRLQFIRRPRERSGTAGTGDRRMAFVDGVPAPVCARWSTWRTLEDLLDGQFERIDAPATRDPFLLVCTHAKHDQCCAVRGRPILDALVADGRVDVWETSHLGGDRFAANVMVAPTGAVHGRVDLSDVDDLIDAAVNHRVVPRRLRGLAGWPTVVQAAQHEARGQGWGTTDAESLAANQILQPGEHRWQVHLDVGDGRTAAITLVEERVTLDTPATCGGPDAPWVPRFTVESSTLQTP
jgi:hypothetical protein